MNSKAKIIKITELTLKLLIVLLGGWILYKELFLNNEFNEVWHEIKNSFTNVKDKQFFLKLIVLLLFPLNIYLEAIKWKIQLKPIENINTCKSFISIFTGITSGMFFPNRMGNFVGRVFMLEKADRIKASLLSIVGGMSQMIATICVGLFAALFFVKINLFIKLIIVITVITILLLMYFNIDLLKYFQFLIPKKFKENTKDYLDIFSHYSKKELLIILLYSFLKYFLYTFQFVILLWSFNVPLTYFNAMIPISLTYLLMMIVPFITITEIAIRGSVSIIIFEQWFIMNGIDTSYKAMVFSASSLLWIINIALPSIIGLFLINRLKFFRNKNEL